MKIGPVDAEIALLMIKKEEINASKIYSKRDKKCAVASTYRRTQEVVHRSLHTPHKPTHKFLV